MAVTATRLLDWIVMEQNPVAGIIDELQRKLYSDDEGKFAFAADHLSIRDSKPITEIIGSLDETNETDLYWMQLLVDILDFIKNPVYRTGASRMEHDMIMLENARGYISEKKSIRELANEAGLNIREADESSSLSGSNFYYLTTDDLIRIKAMQYTLAEQISRGEIINSRGKGRARPIVHEIEALKLSLEMERKYPDSMRLVTNTGGYFPSSEFVFNEVKKILLYIAGNQAKKGREGKSFVYETIIIPKHEFIKRNGYDYEIGAPDFAYFDANLRNRKLLIPHIFENLDGTKTHSDTICGYVMGELYMAIDGKLPESQAHRNLLMNIGFQALTMAVFLDHNSYSPSDMEEISQMNNITDLQKFLSKRFFTSDKYQALALSILDFSAQNSADNGIFGYYLSASASPFRIMADAISNFCMTFGNANQIGNPIIKPANDRDFSWIYTLHPSVHVLGLEIAETKYNDKKLDSGPENYFNRGRVSSDFLAKANMYVVDNIERDEYGKISKVSKALMIDDMPGIDLLDKIFPDWYSSFYSGIVKYAQLLRAQGIKIENLLLNVGNQSAQKSVNKFKKLAKQFFSEGYSPKTYNFEAKERTIDFSYTNEIAIDSLPAETVARLQKDGYEHFIGQFPMDAAYSWYELLMKNIDSLPDEESFRDSPLISKSRILELIQANRKLSNYSKNAELLSPEFNYGRALINAVSIPFENYASETAFIHLGYGSGRLLRVKNDEAKIL